MVNSPFKKNDVPDLKGNKLAEFKEIKPRKPRKKKETPRPWGKIERTIVFTVLISAPVLSILFFVHSRNSKSVQPADLTPAIFDKVATIQEKPKDNSELQNDLENAIPDLHANYGIWVQSLDNSYSFGLNEIDQFDGASLFKLPLMIAYYKQVDTGQINPSTSYTIRYSDQMAGAGVIATMPAGTTVTYKDLIAAIGKNSDNSAFAIIANILGEQPIKDTIKDLDMESTSFDNNQTTPKDIGKLFYSLQNGSVISNRSRDELLNFIVDTDYENFLRAGIPGNIKVAHKYANDDGGINDAGVVYSQKPFILIILSRKVGEEDAKSQFSKIAQIVYNWAGR